MQRVVLAQGSCVYLWSGVSRRSEAVHAEARLLQADVRLSVPHVSLQAAVSTCGRLFLAVCTVARPLHAKAEGAACAVASSCVYLWSCVFESVHAEARLRVPYVLSQAAVCTCGLLPPAGW